MISFEAVWERIRAHEGKPFVTDKGHEFHFRLTPENEVRFSCWKTPASKEILAEAWGAMPCEEFRKLPMHCKPRQFIWAILHDTRISGLLPPDDSKQGRRPF